MSVYEETLGTGWEALAREEVVERAFALGVADALSSAPAGELDRLRSQVTGRYDRSLVDLAYREGQAKASGLRDGLEDREVWDDLVGSDDESATDAEPADFLRGAGEAAPRPTDLPGSLSGRPVQELSRDELERLGLPEFLR